MPAWLPEALIFFSLVFLLLQESFAGERGVTPLLAWGAQALALFCLPFLPGEASLLGGSFLLHPQALLFKAIFLLSALVCTLYAVERPNPDREGRIRGEFLMTLQASLLGAMVLVSAGDLITLLIGLELATLPAVALSAWARRNPQSGEGGLKYVLLAALSSALLLFGFALLIGLSGSLALEAPARPLPLQGLVLALLLAGAGFKLSLPPFHLWAADVYQGAPTPVAIWLSTASKAAGLAFLFQLLQGPLAGALPDMLPLLALLAVLAMSLGNLVAVLQQNLKRFMAYSSISQAGYLLLGLLDGWSDAGLAAMLYYMLVYVIGNLVVFGVILERERDCGATEIEDFRGLIRLRPGLATAMLLGLLSLAGIPPLAGFTGKWFLFAQAAAGGWYWVVLLAAVNSTISLYYYLRIVRQMFIEVDGDLPVRGDGGTRAGRIIAAGTVAICLAGILPWLYEGMRGML